MHPVVRRALRQRSRQPEHRADHPDRDRDRRQPERAPDVGDFLLQRGGRGGGGVEQGGDGTHFGGHVRGGDQRAAAALGDGGALEHHAQPVAEADRFGERGSVFQHGLALAGQRGFHDPQRGGLDQPRVGADRVPLGQHKQVAAHESGARDALRLSVADDRRGHRRHAGEGGDGTVRLGLLQHTDHCVEHDHHADDDRVHRPAVLSLDPPRAGRHCRRREQQHDERVRERGQRPSPGAGPRGGAQGVGAVVRQTPGGFRRGQAQGGVGCQCPGHRLDGQNRGVVEEVGRWGHVKRVMSSSSWRFPPDQVNAAGQAHRTRRRPRKPSTPSPASIIASESASGTGVTASSVELSV